LKRDSVHSKVNHNTAVIGANLDIDDGGRFVPCIAPTFTLAG
jgi:hypothetical protein